MFLQILKGYSEIYKPKTQEEFEKVISEAIKDTLLYISKKYDLEDYIIQIDDDTFFISKYLPEYILKEINNELGIDIRTYLKPD